MHSLLIAAATVLASGQELATHYEGEQRVRTEAELSIALEVTSFRMFTDGALTQSSVGGGSTSEKRRVLLVDEVLEAPESVPAHVRRTFTKVELDKGVNQGGLHSQVLEGIALDLRLGDQGKVQVELFEGTEPNRPMFLRGHELGFGLDALLPSGEVEEGATWSLEDEAVFHALKPAVGVRFFPTSQDLEAGQSQAHRERDRRRGSSRRNRGGLYGGGALELDAGSGGQGGGHTAFAFLGLGVWRGTATLAAPDQEYEGASCAVIELELEATGDVPRRVFPGQASAAAADQEPGGSFELSLAGRLVFSNAARRPLLLELEGPVNVDRITVFAGGGGQRRTETTQEGTLSIRIALAEE